MYSPLLVAHSYLRYVILILLIVVIITSLMGMINKKPYSATDNKLGLFLFISTHIQLLLGLILFFVSPIIKFSGVLQEYISPVVTLPAGAAVAYAWWRWGGRITGEAQHR